MSRNNKVTILLILAVLGAFVVLKFILHALAVNFWYVVIAVLGIYIGSRFFRK